MWLTALSSPPQAAKIPLSSELGIDEFHFNDFSLDNDAMITASLRMFQELGVVQKFKIDYEVKPKKIMYVRVCVCLCTDRFMHIYINIYIHKYICYMQTDTYIHIYLQLYIYINMYVHVYALYVAYVT